MMMIIKKTKTNWKKEKEKEEKKKIKEKNDEILYENYEYKLSTSNILLQYFLVVIGKDIYYYKTNTKEELLGMHNLSGCYIKPNGDKI